MSLFRKGYRYYLIRKNRGRLRLGHDTNLSSRNFVISNNGTITIGDGVVARGDTQFTCSGGSLIILDGAFFNRNCLVACHQRIYIGKDVIFGPNVCVYDHDHAFSLAGGVKKNEFKCSEVFIDDSCWIGANVVILRGTHLGKGCIVGAGAIVHGELPDYSLIKSTLVFNYEPIK